MQKQMSANIWRKGWIQHLGGSATKCAGALNKSEMSYESFVIICNRNNDFQRFSKNVGNN